MEDYLGRTHKWGMEREITFHLWYFFQQALLTYDLLLQNKLLPNFHILATKEWHYNPQTTLKTDAQYSTSTNFEVTY